MHLRIHYCIFGPSRLFLFSAWSSVDQILWSTQLEVYLPTLTLGVSWTHYFCGSNQKKLIHSMVFRENPIINKLFTFWIKFHCNYKLQNAYSCFCRGLEVLLGKSNFLYFTLFLSLLPLMIVRISICTISLFQQPFSGMPSMCCNTKNSSWLAWADSCTWTHLES